MSNRFEYDQQTFEEWEASLHTLGLSPLAFAKLKGVAARRVGDTTADLWTTFNVVQENVIRGGLHGVRRNPDGTRRRVSTRAVNGIDQDVKLNKALWLLAQRMAEIKGMPLAA